MCLSSPSRLLVVAIAARPVRKSAISITCAAVLSLLFRESQKAPISANNRPEERVRASTNAIEIHREY
jgi:hypothetical protein